ncbi:formamidopyrimidine-DNA glycosylase [Amycolatopsis endophytica]|uniref:Formamidopyrimidine-DNA glycosylase n=1 Tax=Amycolatopsis endophytica TaxID=860233 RepID=A0A853BCC1_9PSEU|nr:Fpg/Nei family DNA glycosylase [Amycolatopsis endophytica]NYI92829.1 formamidopyrimidine-DNA glycosylase [Amycolatopsis endophytica]
MPELPDVEGFRRVLDEHAKGKRIDDVVILDAGVLRDVSARRVRGKLRNQRFAKPRRLGKWLIAPVSGSQVTVVLHFGMTGSFQWASAGDERQKHDRVVFVFDDGELRYRDMRKLQGLRLVAGGSDLDRLLAETGPDALDVSRQEFRDLLAGRRQLKPLLVDQSVVSGLGNLLVDEILWRAKLNPRVPAGSLDRQAGDALHREMLKVLRAAVKAERVPPRKSWLTGRRDEPSGSCPRCGTTLEHGRVGGRGTVWCPRCQSG